MIAGPASAPDAALSLTNVSKRFGSTIALDDVSMTVRPGSMHALLGENGAGKTTLMRIAFGLVRQDSGAVRIGGSATPIRSPGEAIAAGVGMVHQHFTNVGAMTIAENVALGGKGVFDGRRAARRVDEIGERTGLRLDPAQRAEHLPVGGQQRLEIVKALARDARVLILDEPTAVLAPQEAADLLRWLRRYADDGNAVVLITHKLRDALALSDDITVLRHGRVVSSAPRGRQTESSLAAALLGEEPPESTAKPHSATRGAVVAELRHVTVMNDRGVKTVHDASLQVHGGEVVGIAAVEGSGQHALLRVLSGRVPASSGEVVLPATIGFVPEDRQQDALILEFDAAENVALKGAGARGSIVPWGAMQATAARLATMFDVRGAVERGSSVRALSGGNQQKLVLARELEGAPTLLVVENPTRGLDIRATREIHERLRACAAAGAGVVLYSSDLDEVLALSDRVLAMHAGATRECDRDRERVGAAMLGIA